MFAKNKGFKGMQMVNVIMGLIVVIIMVTAVAIPVIQDVLNSANITGIPNTIISLTPTFLALLVLLMIANLY